MKDLFLLCIVSESGSIMGTTLLNNNQRDALVLSPVDGSSIEIHTPVTYYQKALELNNLHEVALRITKNDFSPNGNENGPQVESLILEHIAEENQIEKDVLSMAVTLVEIGGDKERIKQIKLLRQATGAGLKTCKDALEVEWAKCN